MSSLSQTPANVETDEESVDEAAVARVMGRTKDNFSALNTATKVRVYQDLVESAKKHYPYSSSFKPMDELILNVLTDDRTPYCLDSIGRPEGYVHIPLQILDGPHKDLSSKFIVVRKFAEGFNELKAVATERRLPYLSRYYQRFEVDILLLSRNANLAVIHIGFAEDETYFQIGLKYSADSYTLQPVGFDFVGRWLDANRGLHDLTYWISIALDHAASDAEQRASEQRDAAKYVRDCCNRASS